MTKLEFSMSLIGPRPRSVYDLPPRRVAPLLTPGTCYQCGSNLNTPTQVALHGRCDPFLGMKRRRRGERDARVRL